MDEILERLKLMRLMLDDLERAVRAELGPHVEAEQMPELDPVPLTFGAPQQRSTTLGPITASELQGR